jgi:ABC-type bacteriocin/lantibiotic exporter with double-glycine peptidase domain
MQSHFLILGLALLATCAGTLRAEDYPQEGPSFTCGINAAYLFLEKAGHHTAYDELLRDFENQNPPDSLLAIKKVLEDHGCATLGIKTDADYFLDGKKPAIVYLQLSGIGVVAENHFSFLVGANRQRGVELLDPIFNVDAPSRLTWDTFCRSFQGMALVLK